MDINEEILKNIQRTDSPNSHYAQQLLQQQMIQAQLFAAGAPPTLLPMTSQTGLFGIPGAPNNSNLTKYQQLLLVIEEIGKDIRPTYAGSKTSAERLKRSIIQARILVRECLMETERANQRN